jgi:tetratricopeptide (TPR) repeat protein
VSGSESVFVTLPDPGRASCLDDLVERLRLLKVWAGDPSYETITGRVNAVWKAGGRPTAELAGRTTVADCFRAGRRRLNTDLVVAVVAALHPDAGYVTQWRQALQVIAGEALAGSQVRVHDRLPQDVAWFTGRTAELDRLGEALNNGEPAGGAVVISAIAGMAGVGKTQLAIHAAHLLVQEQPFDRTLFVNLRGFHPDPAQPPADPAAVLDGFLRLLGVAGQQIPHDLAARTDAYRDRLAGTRTLVVLDNAASEEQLRPLLPETPGCLVLVTSRRSLTALHSATHLTVDVFTPLEAAAFLVRATAGVPAGADPTAQERIAHRCGYLPLALGLVAGHVRATPGWTLTDHADRLDERHHRRRLDTGVELAFDLSYLHQPSGQQRLLRLAALHPGENLDAYAAAALTDTDLATARSHLDDLGRDRLLQPAAPGRYTFHDLVRAYAAGRAGDEDPPPERRAALTRLFDYYLAAAAAAVDTLHPAEPHRRPRVRRPGTPAPAVSDLDTALAWLDNERPTLVAVAAHAASHGWPTHAIQLSTTLFRYLDGGHAGDALTIHGHAHRAALWSNDRTAQANALTNLGTAQVLLGQYRQAADHLQQALALFRQTGDPVGRARALNNLGNVDTRRGRYRSAADHYAQALAQYQQVGDRIGEARALGNLGALELRLGRQQAVTADHDHAPRPDSQPGEGTSEADVLTSLGGANGYPDWRGMAADHLQQALALFRHCGDRIGESWVLDNLGTLHTHVGQPAHATELHQQALAIVRKIGDRDGEVWSLNSLGEAAQSAGRPADAIIHHTNALAIVADTGDRGQQARAHAGLGHAHRALGDSEPARHHYQHALTLYTDLGTPEADQIRAQLGTGDCKKNGSGTETVVGCVHSGPCDAADSTAVCLRPDQGVVSPAVVPAH